MREAVVTIVMDSSRIYILSFSAFSYSVCVLFLPQSKRQG